MKFLSEKVCEVTKVCSLEFSSTKSLQLFSEKVCEVSKFCRRKLYEVSNYFLRKFVKFVKFLAGESWKSL